MTTNRDDIWDGIEEDLYRLTDWNADQSDISSIRNKIDQYLVADDDTVNELTDEMIRAREEKAYGQGKAVGYEEGKDDALATAIFTDLPFGVRMQIAADQEAAEQKAYARGRADGDERSFDVLTLADLPRAEQDRLKTEHHAKMDLAYTRGRSEGYADARKALVFDDLPEEERQRVDSLRTQAHQAGYVRGYNEGIAKAPRTAVAGREYLPADVKPGAVVQAAGGGVWLHIGIPEQLARESTPRPERAAVTTVTAQSLSSVAPDKRKCRVCDQIKDLETEFYRDSRGRQGRKTLCKTCDETRKRKYNEARKRQSGEVE